jgi:hypothetical protein
MKLALRCLILTIFFCSVIGCVSPKSISIKQDVQDKYVELTRLENSFNATLYLDYKTTATQMPSGLVLFGHEDTMYRVNSAIQLFRNHYGSIATEAMLTEYHSKFGINEAFITSIKLLPPRGRLYSMKDNAYLFWKYGANFKH